MKLFRDYTFTWWQTSLFKLYLVSAGLLIGAHFPDVVMQYKKVLAALFITLLIYFLHQLLTRKI